MAGAVVMTMILGGILATLVTRRAKPIAFLPVP